VTEETEAFQDAEKVRGANQVPHCGALCVERVSSAGVERNGEYPVRVEKKLR
jgi:hypothetical protein